MRDAFPSPSRRQQTTQMLLEPSHLSLTHGPSRRLPSPALALKGATSYWASVVANPPGHMSRAGLQATGANLVAPGGSARPARLQQVPTRRCQRYRGKLPTSVGEAGMLTPVRIGNGRVEERGGAVRRSTF